jgi:uncharacterized membrane protein YeaQ/YmgE (transglycosylase-associated protein family)
MAVAYAVVGFIGAMITALILWWRYGALMALLAAPFGACLLVLVVAVLLRLRPDNRNP